jgi:ankyrin repeat protein
MIEKGADINIRCIDFQSTPLFWAVKSHSEENDKFNQIECIKLLIQAGADKNIPNSNNNTIYSMTREGDLELKEILSN